MACSKQIFIHSSALLSSLAVDLLSRSFPNANFITVTDGSQIGNWPVDRHTIYVGPRTLSFVHTCHQPKDFLCAPSRTMLIAETGCAFGCHYCYLNTTIGFTPYVHIASNMEAKGIAEMEQALRSGQRIMFLVGWFGDGRQMDPYTRFSELYLHVLKTHSNGMLQVFSKSGEKTIGKYLSLADSSVSQRVIHTVSVNPQTVINLTETDTPTLESRLRALRDLYAAGYRIRVMIEPVFDLRDWGYDEAMAFGEYDRLVDAIKDYCMPEMVILGSYRTDPKLSDALQRLYPESPVLKALTTCEGAVYRLATRDVFYRRLVERLHAVFPGARIALCGESESMWQAVGLRTTPFECGCLPLIYERRG